MDDSIPQSPSDYDEVYGEASMQLEHLAGGRAEEWGTVAQLRDPTGQTYWDDISGEQLSPELVRAARHQEMEYVEGYPIWVQVPEKECWDETGKAPIGTKWVDTNKGDKINPDVRSRLVAKEINISKRDDLFAATPPLEAIKVLVALLAASGGEYQLMLLDISRAYFLALARRKLYVRLPPEADAPSGTCGRLLRSMYGTRDAAQNWEYHYREVLVALGFRPALTSPCVFVHDDRDVRVVVHGDDFSFLGSAKEPDWAHEQMINHFQLKCPGRIGRGCVKQSMRLLNRIIEWTPQGVLYEPDQRHAEIICSQLGLESTAQSVSTPGVAVKEGPDDEDVLSPEQTTRYRAMVARAFVVSLSWPFDFYPGNFITLNLTTVKQLVRFESKSVPCSVTL
eukprot:gene255-biopygen667